MARSSKRYDYLFHIDEQRLSYWRDHEWKRILRKLVRDAIAKAYEYDRHADTTVLGNRIAKALVP